MIAIIDAYYWAWPLMAMLLADATSDSSKVMEIVMPILGWVTTFVTAVIGAVAVVMVRKASKSEGIAQGKQEAQQIGPQPFIVQLREEFATRRELEKLEATMTGHVTEMKSAVLTTTTKMEGLFRETMTFVQEQQRSSTAMIERRHKATMEEIGKVAQGAYTGRQKIWEVVNTQRESLAEVRAHTNVAGELGKMAEAIQDALEANKK